MGSTGDADRKRRHVGSVSPAAAPTKKQPFTPISEDKKLGTAVLQFQNQKLVQKLEAQKVEYTALENKLTQLQEQQLSYDPTVGIVNRTWDQLVNGLESCSIHMRGAIMLNSDDGTSSSVEDAFLSRLMETGATESSSMNNCLNHVEEKTEIVLERTTGILRNILLATDDLWYHEDQILAASLKEILQDDGECRQKACTDLAAEVKNLRLLLSELHVKHKRLAKELQSYRDADARNKAELRCLKGELENTIADLEENKANLVTLKSEGDGTKGAFFPVFSFGNKLVANEKARDKQRDLHEMESTLKELQDQASSRLEEVKLLQDDCIRILREISVLENRLKSMNCVSSSQICLLLKDQLDKSKLEAVRYQALYEKLQMEKDNLHWREVEMSVNNDISEVHRRSSAVADSRAAHLALEIEKQIEEKNAIQKKLEDAAKEPGRQEIISNFRALVSSFPEDMRNMQAQLRKYKEAAVDVHSLRADVQSLSSILERKVKESEDLSNRSKGQVAEIKKLQAMVQDLKESEMELKLILEMYRRECTDSREIVEARDLEYLAWAHVESMKSCLDEHQLELRVKTAIEAEATSQQRLAAAEAEIADLRQRLEAFKREFSNLSDILTSKSEENEAYLSEIESIGQAYDDMQNQNQHLLQQITERDDYNIKLVLEGLRARQLRDTLFMEKEILEKEIQLASTSLEFFSMKAGRIEDQLKVSTEKVQKLSEDNLANSINFDGTQKRLVDVRSISQQVRESMEELQSKLEKGRGSFGELQIELERERFDKKRLEEELLVVRRKADYLQAQMEGSSVLEKLRQELREYREILKCSICLDRRKEVVITKCYHLFCSPCVQKIIENRHRKCPVCYASFGSNDVKPVYI